MSHSHARQCDCGGGIEAAHGATGKMLGPFGAFAQVGLAGCYIRHRVRELRGEHHAFDGSPGLRVCVIVGRSFVDDVVLAFA